MRKILGRKSGWLIGVDVVSETPKAFIVKALDEKKLRRVSKASKTEKLFDSTGDAEKWISAG